MHVGIRKETGIEQALVLYPCTSLRIWENMLLLEFKYSNLSILEYYIS